MGQGADGDVAVPGSNCSSPLPTTSEGSFSVATDLVLRDVTLGDCTDTN